MTHHEFYNTVWTHRDQEFWWDGIKTGTIFGAVACAVVIADCIILIKSLKGKKKES